MPWCARDADPGRPEVELATADQLTHRQRVWIAYAKEDALFASQIMGELQARGKDAWVFTEELGHGSWSAQSTRYVLSSADYLVLLLSRNSIDAAWPASDEGRAALTNLENRGITLVPVLVDDASLPPLFAGYQALSLQHGSKAAVATLVDQMGRVPTIEFSGLDRRQFARLIGELLEGLGFRVRPMGTPDGGSVPDFAAEYRFQDPFRTEVVERWAIGVKLHRDERANPVAVRQLSDFLTRSSEFEKAAIITDGQATSVTRAFAASEPLKGRASVRIIEGTELRRLLLSQPRLTEKFFGSVGGS
jgi:hypothetical protein